MSLPKEMQTQFRFGSLNDYLLANELTVDATLDDGWGATFAIKGREIDAAVLFADISSFTARTADMSPVETLVFVNRFFAWMTAEALHGRPGIIDKYIGDELMVVFSAEFGSEDPFADAIYAASKMCSGDVLDYAPHIGIAHGPVIVGYTGTPVMHNCSVFGAPVALAARCCGIGARAESFASHSITFPAVSWGEREVNATVAHRQYREDGEVKTDEWSLERWKLTDEFLTDLKGRGEVGLRQLHDEGSMRINTFTVEEQTKETVEFLHKANRYWPSGRHPQVP